MPDPSATPRADLPPMPRRLLITAGPTHEPIDRVRFIGNRSSGRLGIDLADAAAQRSSSGPAPRPGPDHPEWDVTLLLGPTHLTPSDPRVHTHRFQSTADLQALLADHAPRCDVLIMAAAVADYRPRPAPDIHQGKLRRGAGPMVLELDPTPDLLAGIAQSRRPGQLIIGFALEPRERLLQSAAAKLERKGIDLIVANPLETMDAPTIQATILDAHGIIRQFDAPVSKAVFATALIDLITARLPRGTHP